MRASILVSLHRFPEARDLARSILDRSPGDATALGVLGDASLETGDLATASTAYSRLALVADGSASRVRAARLAFVQGDPAAAVAGDVAAVSAAIDEGLEGDALGFYDVTLGETLISAGDASGARSAFMAALDVRPGLPAALAGPRQLDAFDGDPSAAISKLDDAIAAIPLPDWLARRADLLTLRGDPGDARKAEADRATVEAIAQLAGDAGSVYDRGLSIYLSDHGLEPERAVKLARDELAVRPTSTATTRSPGRCSTPATPRRRRRDAVRAGRRHPGRPALVPRRADRARQRPPAEAAASPENALALGPALDPRRRPRASDALATIR